MNCRVFCVSFFLLLFGAAFLFSGENVSPETLFRDPPPGYGEVPFWWWTGEKLDSKRLIQELEELHKAGVSGVQVNYAHHDARPWLTYPNDPEIFTPEWWEVYDEVAAACAERGMGIGLSGYTIDWQKTPGNLFSRIVYNSEETLSRNIIVEKKLKCREGDSVSETLSETEAKKTAAVIFYPYSEEGLPMYGEGIDLLKGNAAGWESAEGKLTGTASGAGEIWFYGAEAVPNTLNPLHPDSGKRVVEQFFQPFEDHSPTGSAEGLNYFFQDELQIGTGSLLWSDDLPEEFFKRKGYSLFEALPVFFDGGAPYVYRADKNADPGNSQTVNRLWPPALKYRLDWFDVRVRLAEERYFKPIYEWHASRGLIYACDPGSRGYDPFEFCDYFSAVRWYTAPGHDTPGGKADFIKNRVSSSIAHFYHRPRVWLEGYHSLGWGAAPERIFQATCENFIYGANLLNLHGLYYSTYGGWWEWAPPCYHFRMPYWSDFPVLLRYFERLSWLMSRGEQKADILISYPVTEYQGGESGKNAADTAFQTAKVLADSGYNAFFVDDDSILRGRAEEGKLEIDGQKYGVIILPNLSVIRWPVLNRLREFKNAGGTVLALNGLPFGSDRAGAGDPEFDRVLEETFGESGAVLSGEYPELGKVLTAQIEKVLPRDLEAADSEVNYIYQHRTFEDMDIYVVMGVSKGEKLIFRASGKAECWDPWTGDVTELNQVRYLGDGKTEVSMPKEKGEAQVIVFHRNEKTLFDSLTTDLDEIERVEPPNAEKPFWSAVGRGETEGEKRIEIVQNGKTVKLTGKIPPIPAPKMMEGSWESEIVPTLNNEYGDFRLPVKEKVIGPEARRFDYLEVLSEEADWTKAEQVTCGFGPYFLKLGPFSDTLSEEERAALDAAVGNALNPTEPVTAGDKTYEWMPYSFSWREGIEGNPGHEGYHGLKEMVDDRFIGLGKTEEGLNETCFVPNGSENINYLLTWVCAEPAEAGENGTIGIETEGDFPAAVFLAGKPVSAEMPLKRSAVKRPLLIRCDKAGRFAFVLVDRAVKTETVSETPLAMKWFDMPGRLDFDIRGGLKERPRGYYRFTAPPGLKSVLITSKTPVRLFADGKEYKTAPLEADSSAESGTRGNLSFRADFGGELKKPAEIVLTATPADGDWGGALFSEPIRLECGTGEIELGNWNKMGVLETYSGGILYRRSVTVSEEEAKFGIVLELGNVSASARVAVNGEEAGRLVTSPWRIDISRLIHPGENEIEIEVRNTLSNHYKTIPTRYGGDSPSGLIGPVSLRFFPRVEMKEEK